MYMYRNFSQSGSPTVQFYFTLSAYETNERANVKCEGHKGGEHVFSRSCVNMSMCVCSASLGNGQKSREKTTRGSSFLSLSFHAKLRRDDSLFS